MICYQDKFDRQDRYPFVGAAVRGILPADAVVEPLRGGFSNTNVRFRRPGEEGWRVLRIAHRGASTLAREVSLSERLARRIPVPRVLDHGVCSAGQRPFAILEYVPGSPLAEVLEADDTAAWCGAARAAGRALAAVHSVEFPAAGFFDASLRVVDELGPVGPAFCAFTCGCLGSDLARERLGADELARTREFVVTASEQLAEACAGARLVHSDFNSKNLLVAEGPDGWEVTAVLDWEFAFAGPPLVDLGNFLRFAHERPPAVTEAFVSGYEERAGPLPGGWRRTAAVLDLSALVEMLVRPGAGPRTVATVRAAIGRTIEAWCGVA